MAAPKPEVILAVAEELHKFYRAAFISQHSGLCSMMGIGRRQHGKGSGCRNVHDHGWKVCHKKAYFLKRAVIFLQAPIHKLKLKSVPF